MAVRSFQYYLHKRFLIILIKHKLIETTSELCLVRYVKFLTHKQTNKNNIQHK